MDKGSSIKEIIKEIHANAVAHGWWDEERDYEEIYALIHSEWSEALEEYRAGRPDRWFACKRGHVVDKCSDPDRQLCVEQTEMPCPHLDAKPEGICVELIDGVIRIYDYVGKLMEEKEQKIDLSLVEYNAAGMKWGLKLPNLVHRLHGLTEYAASMRDETIITLAGTAEKAAGLECTSLLIVAKYVMCYIESRGFDPMELLLEKHEYNKTRPYKHGKVC